MSRRWLPCALVVGLTVAASACGNDDRESGALVSAVVPYELVDGLCRQLDGSVLGEAAGVTARIVDKASDSERAVACALDDAARDRGITLTLNTVFYGSTQAAVSDVDAGAISRDWFEVNLNDVAEVPGWDDGLIGTRYESNAAQLYAKVRDENVIIEIIYYVGLQSIAVDDPETVMRDAAVDLAEQVRLVIGSAN